MNYPANCKKCNQPLYGPVKYCPFCGIASVSVADISAEKKPVIVNAEINTPLIQEEHAPDVGGDIRQEGKQKGSSDENKKVIDKTPQKPESEIRHEEVITELEKTSVQQKVGIDKSSVSLPRDSGGSGHNDDGTNDGNKRKRKRKEKPIKMIAIAAVIILIIGGFFYYDNINKTKMEKVKKELIQKEEKLREDARKAEDAAKKGEIERQRAEAERLRSEMDRLKAEADKANIAKELAIKEADAMKVREREKKVVAPLPEIRRPEPQLPNRDEIDKYLTEGKSLFEKGKYRECSEMMNKVLQKNPNNSMAKWYIKEASKRIEKSKNLSDTSANMKSRRW